MKRIVLVALLALLVAGVSGCRCIAQGVNGLGKDFQAWTQPYIEEQKPQHYAQE
jgi:predicted small secreted protein